MIEARPSFSPEKDRYGEATLRLTGSAVALALDDRGTSVVPYLETGLAKFWLSLSIALVIRRDVMDVKSVLIGVWRGEVATAPKELVVRAEWGPMGAPRKTGEHAQPHWHVHMPVETATVPTAVSFSEVLEEEPAEFIPVPPSTAKAARLPIEDLHLAMAARWHYENKDAHTATCEPEQVAAWVGGCVGYMRQQLLYVLTGD